MSGFRCLTGGTSTIRDIGRGTLFKERYYPKGTLRDVHSFGKFSLVVDCRQAALAQPADRSLRRRLVF
jgi:hypothetical protein